MAETPAYLVDAERSLSEEDREQLSQYLALDPSGGELLPGQKFLRSIKWKPHGKGSAIHVIYFYSQVEAYIFLLAVCANRAEATRLIQDDPHLAGQLVEELINACLDPRLVAAPPGGAA